MTKPGKETLPFCNVTPAHLAAGINWFENMCRKEKWDLSQSEKLKLLANITYTQYVEILASDTNSVLREEYQSVAERISILLGISKGLDALAGTGSPIALFTKPNSNPIFKSSSIKDFLLNTESTDDFYKVRDYLHDATNGHTGATPVSQ